MGKASDCRSTLNNKDYQRAGAHMSEETMWRASLAEARLVQQRLRAKVITEDRLDRVQIVAGVDAWTEPAGGRIWAAAVALRLSGLELQESAVVCQPAGVPYVPGFLSLREAPAALAALELASAAGSSVC